MFSRALKACSSSVSKKRLEMPTMHFGRLIGASVSILEETLKQTQVTQERVFLSTRLVTPQYPPKTARGGGWGEGDLSSTV